MDSLITAAARALAAGDPLGALNRVALRDDAPALALRGIAMAQLSDFERAKALLRRGARVRAARGGVARARCVVAEAEIALAARDLGWPVKALEAARVTLEAHGDHAQRRARALSRHPPPAADRTPRRGRARARGARSLPVPARAARTAHELIVAGIAMRRLRTRSARAALDTAQRRPRAGAHSGADGRSREAPPRCSTRRPRG